MFQDLTRYNSILKDINTRSIVNQFSGLVYIPYSPTLLGSFQNKTITINVNNATFTISGSPTVYRCFFIPGSIKATFDGDLTTLGYINTDVLYTIANSKLYFPTDLASFQPVQNPTIIHSEIIGQFIVNFPIVDIFRSRAYVIDANYSIAESEGIYKVSLLRFTGTGSIAGIRATDVVVSAGSLTFDQAPEPARGDDSSGAPLSKNTIIKALQMYPDRIV